MLLSLLLAAATFGDDASEAPTRALARELSGFTRLAGTSGSRVGAVWAARELERAGFTVELDEREIVLSYPRSVRVALFDDASVLAPAMQRGDRFDPNARPTGDVPLYNGWAKSAKLRAAVVDAGYGLRADFERLKAAGIDVTGRVVLARYGHAYRGVKPELAAEYGAIAVLLWTPSDDDGAGKGEVWPYGPWKPDRDAQRGSILSMARTPGDPSTPGFASARPGAGQKRVLGAELDALLPTIPCLPIGAREADWLRAHLAFDPDGKTPLGPGPAEVALELDAPRELRTIVNVVATLSGVGDELVLAGAHRDAWVRGMNDDGSGVVTLIRAAQHLGARVKNGWKPTATVRIALWDAEEFGLIGSTEYGEGHAEELARHARLYINTDSGCSGTTFGADGSPGLIELLHRALERVDDPSAPTPRNLWQQWTEKNPTPELGFPGSGSDFAVFLHHLSVPVVDIGFGGASGGQYHTRFDDFGQVDRFLDPGWKGHELAGTFLAELLRAAADEPARIFDPSEAARALAGAARGQKQVAWLGPERAERLAVAFDGLAARPQADAARHFYARFAFEPGLPGRTWFKNRLWAPGLETGYSSELFPSLTEAARRGANDLDRELDDLIGVARGLTSER
ncbi:MAG: M28 family peptidase [Planctomycetes bacterium]|nr:M28 family peptidase [Planctomycetota bacterium]